MKTHLRRRLPARRRGQAATEAALGILLFVTIILFGIHFAEIGYLSVKVPEVAASALWDATAYKHNEMGSTIKITERGNAINQGKNKAQSRYKGDLDGRTSWTGKGTHVLTQVGDVTVTCQEDNNFAPLALEPSRTRPIADNAQGGVWCRAEAELDLFGIRNFHDTGNNGYFKAEHLAQGRDQYKICSLNRAKGGSCNGQLEMLMGDWGLTDGSEAQECELGMGSCTNSHYYDAVNFIYVANGSGSGSAGAALAAALKLLPMIDENHFFMSFRGEDSEYGAFQEQVPSEHDGDQGPKYTVTPGGKYEAVPEYKKAYNKRKPCWLGLKCNFGT